MDDNRAGAIRVKISAGPGISVAETSDPQRPPRVLGFRDLVMFYVVTGISLRWIATRGGSRTKFGCDLDRRLARLLHTARALSD